MKKENEFLTPKEVAKMLEVAESTLAVWRCNGTHCLPYYKIGRNVKYKKQDVLDFIESKRVEYY